MRDRGRANEPVGVRRWWILVGALIGFLAACGADSTPSIPSPSAPPVSAALAIEEASVVVHPLTGGDLWYEPRFRLRETRGTSGATIQNVRTEGDQVGTMCAQGQPRVLPGGTLDRFLIPPNPQLVYCSLGLGSGRLSEFPQVQVVVAFTDDDGRGGTSQGVATLPSVAASLVVEEASIIVRPPTNLSNGRFGYLPRFRLRETSGKSGATIQTIEFSDGGPSGASCWGTTLRVTPGGTLDTFLTDDGAAWLSYCDLWGSGVSEFPELRVVVAFTDDQGRSSQTHALATARR